MTMQKHVLAALTLLISCTTNAVPVEEGVAGDATGAASEMADLPTAATSDHEEGVVVGDLSGSQADMNTIDDDWTDCTEIRQRRLCQQALNCVWRKAGDRKICIPHYLAQDLQMDESGKPSRKESMTRNKENKKRLPAVVAESPWNVQALSVDDDCTKSCPTDRPFLLDGVCVEEAQPHVGARYCSEQVGLWNMFDELEFEALLQALNAGRLDVSETPVVERLIYTRLAALRALPWSMLSQEQILPQEQISSILDVIAGREGEIEGFPRRRAEYTLWGYNKKCFGGNGGHYGDLCWDTHWPYWPNLNLKFCHKGSFSPLEITVRYDHLVKFMSIDYGNPANGIITGIVKGGDKTVPTTEKKINVLDDYRNCITDVAVRSGMYVDGLMFFSNPPGKQILATEWLGGSGGQMHVLSPDYRGNEAKPNCLKEIYMRSGGYVDQICFSFETKFI